MKRPWQFSLLSLLLAMVVFSIIAALIARLGAAGVVLVLAGSAVSVSAVGVARRNKRLILGGIFLFVIAAVSDPLSIKEWYGSKTVPLRFIVVDAASQTPITGANVRLTTEDAIYPSDRIPFGERGLGGTTGPDGSIVLPWEFPTSGYEGVFMHSGQVFFRDGLHVQTSAAGYESQLVPLESVAGWSRDLSDPVPPPMRISLVRKAAK